MDFKEVKSFLDYIAFKYAALKAKKNGRWVLLQHVGVKKTTGEILEEPRFKTLENGEQVPLIDIVLQSNVAGLTENGNGWKILPVPAEIKIRFSKPVGVPQKETVSFVAEGLEGLETAELVETNQSTPSDTPNQEKTDYVWTDVEPTNTKKAGRPKTSA